MSDKKESQLSYTMPDDIKKELDALVEKHGIEGALMEMLETPSAPEATKFWSERPSAYPFWGSETAKLVNTPESLYIPLSFDAFKVSTLDYQFKSPSSMQAYMELVTAAKKILQWSQEQKVDQFFMKNSVFSGKHRWPYTCRVDLTHVDHSNEMEMVGQILNNVHNINSYSADVNSAPGLGLLARRNLDLEPAFYAFGSKFYKLTDTKIKKSKIIEFSGHTHINESLNAHLAANPHITCETFHVGMPITKELRIFTMNGKVTGFVPYWTPVAFKNQNIYGLKPDASFDETLKKLNTFQQNDLDYLRSETEKIIAHQKFIPIDWAIDWVITKDNKWYMIDMQTAKGSYMDFERMIFASKDSKKIVSRFMKDRLDALIKDKKEAESRPDIETLRAMFGEFDIAKALERSGYPNEETIRKLFKEYTILGQIKKNVLGLLNGKKRIA